MSGVRLLTVGLLATAGTGVAQEHAQHETAGAAVDSSAGGRTPLYENLGSYHSRSRPGRRWHSSTSTRGCRLTYGFNHDEAIKAFSPKGRARTPRARCAGGASPTPWDPTSTRRWTPPR